MRIKLTALAAVLLLAACATHNPTQSSEQKLQNTCITIHDAIDDALVYDLSLNALETIDEVKATKDALCRKDGPLLEGMTTNSALDVLEAELERAYRIKREASQ